MFQEQNAAEDKPAGSGASSSGSSDSDSSSDSDDSGDSGSEKSDARSQTGIKDKRVRRTSTVC